MNALMNPFKLFVILARKGMFKNMDDETYLKLIYKGLFGKNLRLHPPISFNEKIQWIKLHDRNPVYTKMVDKYAAKEFVEKIVGNQYIIPTLGVWDRFDDIDFESLPEQFVLKCTHDSGGLVVCRSKEKLNRIKAKEKIEESLANQFYYKFREWAYKDVKPRIIAEKYMEDSEHPGSLTDYKFFCFNGKPKFLYISEGLEHHPTAHISFFDLKGKLLPFHRSDYKPFESDIILPDNYPDMLHIAEKLAIEINNAFVRIDLYSINHSVFFSEITLYPNAGLLPFDPPEWDDKVGELIQL